jgi:hypothetical protein
MFVVLEQWNMTSIFFMEKGIAAARPTTFAHLQNCSRTSTMQKLG